MTSMLAQTERLSTFERDINRLFLICELLLVYLLKTDMRRQITPKILKMHKRTPSVVKLLTLDRRETELEQFILKNKNSELSLIEIDTKTNAIRNVFFLKIAFGSRRFSFGAYKDKSDSLIAVNELENLISNVLANLRNEPLIRQISHKFDHFAINHIKGEQDFTVDTYDKELLNLEFAVSDIYFQSDESIRRHSNDPLVHRPTVLDAHAGLEEDRLSPTEERIECRWQSTPPTDSAGISSLDIGQVRHRPQLRPS
jgi:hypothetical protein